MSTLIPFVKMHGLGNDFVMIAQSELPELIDMNKFATTISDRRLGIGCDQFIVYNQNSDFVEMNIYNQDGSPAKACGNASRCLSRLIFDQTKQTSIIIIVGDRKIQCEYIAPNSIKVDMGEVSFEEPWMPSVDQLWNEAQIYQIEPKEIMCVDVANPHLVIFSKLSNEDSNIIGTNYQNIDLFPQGINVNFARIQNNKIHLKVWERGAGFTYACGSGAIATFAAANKLGFVTDDAEVVFELGVLSMQKIGNKISMTGPASYIFHGKYSYE
ncbi:MAG: diaminopimelate epimerase [Rickettsiaceae bacterium]